MATNKLLAFLCGLVVVLIVIVLGVGYNSQRNSTQLDTMDAKVDQLDAFVDELKETTPDEEAQNAAVSAAVALVPDIRAKQDTIIEILCTGFPEAEGCPPNEVTP